MRRILSLGLTALLALPAAALAATPEEAAIQELQKQIQALSTELEDLSDRLDSAERHSSLDRINLTGDMRVKADSLHYDDITVNQGYMVDFDNSFDTLTFDTPLNPGGNLAGFTGGDLTAAQGIVSALAADPTYAAAFAAYPGLDQAMAAYLAFGQVLGTGVFPNAPANGQHDEDNDILYTTRLRLNMKAKVWDNVNFAGRLTMYKNWGDSTGVKVFDSFNSFTMDGTNSGNTTGDCCVSSAPTSTGTTSATPPSTCPSAAAPRPTGRPPTIARTNCAAAPRSGHVVNFNFDGITVGYDLEDADRHRRHGQRASATARAMNPNSATAPSLPKPISTTPTSAGFNFDAYNDDTTFLQVTVFRALDLIDSFKGLAMMPFADTQRRRHPRRLQHRRLHQPLPGVQENIGDMNLVGVGFTREEYDNGVNWFGSGGWTHTEPNGNYNSMGLGGLLYRRHADHGSHRDQHQPAGAAGRRHWRVPVEYVKSDDWDKERDGYSVYVGVQISGAAWASSASSTTTGRSYWTPFTQAQDDMVGSKLATRGHVGEAYYIFDINPNMFLKIGGIYYDYEYTGSGSPVGKPHKVERCPGRRGILACSRFSTRSGT